MRYLILGGLFWLCGNLHAQGDGRLVGARPGAMGYAFVSMSDIWSAFHNPAGLGELDNFGAGVFVENRFGLREFTLAAAAVSAPLPSGTAALSFQTYGFSLYRENRVGLAYAHRLAPGLSASVQLNYASVFVAGDAYGNTGLVTADFGLLTDISESVRLGAHISNISRTTIQEYEDERVPTIMRLGGSYRPGEQVVIVAEVEKDIRYSASWRAGFEYQPAEVIYLRAGIQSNPGLYTFGFGLDLKQFRVDMAGGYHQMLGYIPQLALTYQPTK